MSKKKCNFDWGSLWHWEHGPAHRWIVARDWVAKELPGPVPDDPWIRAAKVYLEQRPADPRSDSATGRGSWISAAVVIDQDPARRNRLKTLVLAGMARPDMARLVGLEERAILAWESLFFDVRDRLEALDWLVAKVIGPAEDAGDYETAARMRLALQGGPVVAEHMLTADTKFSDEMKLLILKTQVGIKVKRALDIALSTPKSAAQVVQFYSEMLIEEKKLDQAEAAEQRRHEFEMRKLDIEHARALEAKARLDLETAKLTACTAAAQDALQEFAFLDEPPPAESRSAAAAQAAQTDVNVKNETPIRSRRAAA